MVDDLSNSYSDVLVRIRKLAQEYCIRMGRKLPSLKFYECDYRSTEMGFILKQYDTSISFSSREAAPAYTIAQTSSLIKGVIHFAAYKSVEESIQSPLSYYQNNVCGLVELLGQLQNHGIPNFVFSSSATVYGEKTNEGKPLREADLVHHSETHINATGEQVVQVPGIKGLTSLYGRTKYFCEAILADVAYANPSWKITALRYFNPVGCHESGLLGKDPR